MIAFGDGSLHCNHHVHQLYVTGLATSCLHCQIGTTRWAPLVLTLGMSWVVVYATVFKPAVTGQASRMMSVSPSVIQGQIGYYKSC